MDMSLSTVSCDCPVSPCPPEFCQYAGQETYFGGTPPLSLAIGYVVVIGFGALFSIFTTLVVYIDKVFAGNANITSEHFK